MTSDATRSRRIVALLAVVCVALVGVVIFLLVRDDPERAPAPQDSPSLSPSTTAPATKPTEVVESSIAETSPPVDAVTDGWGSVEVAGVVLPVSLTAGPQRLDGGLAHDFERSELGAVMAATHVVFRVSGLAGSDVFEPTIGEQVVAGPDQQRMLSVAQATYDQAVIDQGRDDPRSTASVRGYRVNEYTDDEATVELWTEAPSADGVVRITFTLQVEWVDGRWKLVAPTDGDFDTVSRELVATEQFEQFPDEVT